MMKTILLDIDGVVLPIGAMAGVSAPCFASEPDQYVVVAAGHVPTHIPALLCDVAAEADAKIAIISSWRIMAQEHLLSFLTLIGLGAHLHDDWYVDMVGLPKLPSKGRDICHWLAKHAPVDAIVVDDEDLGLRRDFGLVTKIIQPSPRVGFSRDDASRIRRAWKVT